MKHIKALLFDKDGTLFEFQATWAAWANSLISELAPGNEDRQTEIAKALGFDRTSCRFLSHSVVIAGTGDEVAALIAPHIVGREPEELSHFISKTAGAVPLVEAVPLRQLLTQLRNAGYTLGIATNDYESVAREHISHVADLFSFVAGFDTGHGGKPDPGMLIAFAQQCCVRPDEVLMIGDSAHDLIAGRDAGMATLAVLTGVATAEELAPYADEICPDIGYLPEVLEIM